MAKLFCSLADCVCLTNKQNATITGQRIVAFQMTCCDYLFLLRVVYQFHNLILTVIDSGRPGDPHGVLSMVDRLRRSLV